MTRKLKLLYTHCSLLIAGFSLFIAHGSLLAIVSAESVMKEGYRNDYLPQGVIPRHDMDKAESWIAIFEHLIPRHDMDKAESWIAIFEHPKRDEWQEPDKIIENMKLKEGDVVADIGAGSGYFTRRLAAAVGPTGKA